LADSEWIYGPGHGVQKVKNFQAIGLGKGHRATAGAEGSAGALNYSSGKWLKPKFRELFGVVAMGFRRKMAPVPGVRNSQTRKTNTHTRSCERQGCRTNVCKYFCSCDSFSLTFPPRE